MLFATKNRRAYKILKDIEEPDDQFTYPLLLHTRGGWREVNDMTDDDPETVVLNRPKIHVERSRKFKTGKKKVKGIMSSIGKAVASPLISDLYMLETPPEHRYQGLQFASPPPPPMLSAGVFMFAF